MRMSSAAAPRSRHRAAAAFEQYVSGSRSLVLGAVYFLESPDHVAQVLRQAGPGDVVFAPTGSADVRDPRVIEYHGDFRTPGDEMTIDGRGAIELQDYIAVPFISVVGLTVVRQRSAPGVAAFLADADAARASGIFIDQLLSPAVLLDSVASFAGAAPVGDALARVHVTADGEYRDGPDGLRLGQVGDDRGLVEERAAKNAGRGRAFARVVEPGSLHADLDDRPWLARYIAAIDLLRHWDGVPRRPAISGFGGHLVRALDELPALPGVVSADAPYLLTGDGEQYVLVGRRHRRRFRLGVDAARGAECLSATGDESAATALLAAELGRETRAVAPMIRDLRGRFEAAGIDLPRSPRDAT